MGNNRNRLFHNSIHKSVIYVKKNVAVIVIIINEHGVIVIEYNMMVV